MTNSTKRIVVQVTPRQKQEIVLIAKRMGLNISELMRQAARKFQSVSEQKGIESLLNQVHLSTIEAKQALDETLAFVNDSNQRMEAMKGNNYERNE